MAYEDIPAGEPRVPNYPIPDHPKAVKIRDWAEVERRDIAWKIEEGGGLYRVRGEPR